MKKYPEEQKDIDWTTFPFTKFKIVVPSKKDKKEIMSACKHLHDSRDIDTNYVTVNQLVHSYMDVANDPTIIVDKKLYEKLCSSEKEQQKVDR